jgi:hypothetical protein
MSQKYMETEQADRLYSLYKYDNENHYHTKRGSQHEESRKEADNRQQGIRRSEIRTINDMDAGTGTCADGLRHWRRH